MDNTRGAVIMVLAMLGFAIEDMFLKMVGDAMPVGQILLLLGVGGGTIFGAAVLSRGQRLFVPAMLSVAVALRGLGEMVGTMCFVSAIILTPLSTASAILQATPLVVTLGAALFLGEAVGWRRWSAIGVGFAGVMLIIRPGMDSFSPLSLVTLTGVLGLAVRDVATRKVPRTVTSLQLSFLGFLSLLPAGAGLLWVWGIPPVVPDMQTALPLLGALCITVFAYYGIVAAMRVGEVSFVTPFRYTRMVFALIIGTTVFGEDPDMPTLVGATIIIASGLYTIWRERKHRIPRMASLSKPGPGR